MAKSIPLTLSIEDHDRLESIVKARTLQAQVVTRARILLLKEGGDSVDKIADKVNSTGETIVKVYIGDREWDAFTYESAQRGSKLVGAQPIREGRA